MLFLPLYIIMCYVHSVMSVHYFSKNRSQIFVLHPVYFLVCLQKKSPHCLTYTYYISVVLVCPSLYNKTWNFEISYTQLQRTAVLLYSYNIPLYACKINVTLYDTKLIMPIILRFFRDTVQLYSMQFLSTLEYRLKYSNLIG